MANTFKGRRRKGRVAGCLDKVKKFHGMVVPWYLQVDTAYNPHVKNGVVTHKVTMSKVKRTSNE